MRTLRMIVWWVAGLLVPALMHAQPVAKVRYQDLSHHSKVFGREKSYRLYLPEGYHNNEERFPVIYFFHGWGGRHYMDPSAKLEYELIKDLVDKYRVILVMWDGNYEEGQPRPYNMGNHENITSNIQMKDYFLELVSHIDSTYKTLPDRNHRGIIGFSMGGLMSWFIAGKYPDKVCAAVNILGSPEFFIGYPDNHTLLPLRYAFKNLKDVKIRLHQSTNDELVYLNDEVDYGARWEGGLSYSFQRFRGGHLIDDPGETKIFETAMKFVVEAFKDPLPKSERWWHYDFYPEFDVWDYHVRSNKSEPGFIVLSKVANEGFNISSERWLPDGPPIEGLITKVTTAPVYEPNGDYEVVTWSPQADRMDERHMRANSDGRLAFEFNETAVVGIFRKGDKPDLIVTGYTLEDRKTYLRVGETHKLTLMIYNRAGLPSRRTKAQVELSVPEDASFEIIEAPQATSLSRKSRFNPVTCTVRTNKKAPAHGEPAWIKLGVKIKAEKTFEDEVVLPVFFDVPPLEDVTVDDGRAIRDKAFGKGNGDGIAAPGEHVLLYTGEHRLRLYTDDPYVEHLAERLVDEVVPSRWPDGFTQSSVVRIADNCPDGHVIRFLASYDTKVFETMERKVTWRIVSLSVKR
ncbi:MAG TPA: alpha/beta fold hydrolase [Cyclobacteriaceae bacterium]|jgi:enterochelin esterase-like enzyme